MVFADNIALFESFIDIAPLDMAGNVDVQFDAGMDLRRIFFNRIQRVKDRG